MRVRQIDVKIIQLKETWKAIYVTIENQIGVNVNRIRFGHVLLPFNRPFLGP